VCRASESNPDLAHDRPSHQRRPLHSVLEGVFPNSIRRSASGTGRIAGGLTIDHTSLITPNIRRILLLMNNSIDEQTSEAELRQIPEFGIQFIGRPRKLTEPDRLIRLMNVPALIAEFFIEALATDQPPELRHHNGKVFVRPVVMNIALPEPIPMSFSSQSGGKIQIGFFDTDLESAADIERRVSLVLTAIAQRKMLVASFTNVDRVRFPVEGAAELAEGLGVCVLRKGGDVDEDGEVHSFILKIMQSHWDGEGADRVVARLEALKERSRIAKCANCDYWFCPAEGGECAITKRAHHELETVSVVTIETSPIFPPDPKYA
jgi:hypothetical protein